MEAADEGASAESLKTLTEELRERIEALPAANELSDGDYEGDKAAVYKELVSITEELEKLSEEERELLGEENSRKLEALQEYFATSAETFQSDQSEKSGQEPESEAAGAIEVVGEPNTATYSPNKMYEETMVGPYQLNMAGNTNTRGKFDNVNVYADALHGDIEAEEACGDTLPNLVGGKRTADNTNSSTSVLEKPEGEAQITWAYLVVTATQLYTRIANNTAPLEQYGVFFKGPKGDIQRYYPNEIFYDSDNMRTSMYVDVTDFIRSQGYGRYSAINIPYTNMGYTDWRVYGDMFGAWKLIVVEENPELPLRMVQFQLGGTKITSGTAAQVTIEKEGLTIKDNPTGDLLFSSDGSDMQASGQTMQYRTDKSTAWTSMSDAMHGANKFFTFQIANKGKVLDNNPGPTYAYRNNTTNIFTNASINGGQSFTQYNTDFEIWEINGKNRPNGMNLQGGEKSVTLRATSNNEPSLFSALALAVDIKVPEFETDIKVTNVTQGYSTADSDYNIKEDFASEGDRLKVEASSKNVSTSSNNIGIKNGEFTVETPAFLNIDQSSVKGVYRAPDGTETKLTFEMGEDGRSIVFKTPADVTITSGGSFEVSYEGDAVSTEEYTEYTNRASVEGTFVDDAGNHYESFLLENLSVDYAHTSSNLRTHMISTQIQGGHGTITPSAEVVSGKDYTVNWTVEDGYYVKDVIVDGVIKDGAAAQGSYTFDNVREAHEIIVVVAEGSPADEEFVTVTVETTGEGTTTPTEAIKKGDDHTVTWEPAEGWEVDSVYVDGVKLPDDTAQGGRLTFEDLAKDHKVEITFREEGTGGNPGDSSHMVETDITGGPGTITPTMGYEEGTDVSISWEAEEGYEVISVTVDGELREDLITAGKIDFDSINGSHKVEVVLGKTDETAKKPEGEMEKSVVNRTDEGAPNPGDILEYEIKARNRLPGSIWQNVTIKDRLPAGVELIKDSMILTDPAGESRNLKEEEYTFKDNLLTVPIGPVKGGEEYVLTFQVRIRTEAVEEAEEDESILDLTNTAAGEGSYGHDEDGDGAADNEHNVSSNPAVPEGGKDIVALDPEAAIEKTAANLDREDEQTHVGDTIEYSLKASNDTEGSVWKDVVMRDRLAKGLKPVPGSISLLTPEGEIIKVSDDAYNADTHTIAVYVGDIFGGEEYVLTFRAQVTAEAIGSDIGNKGEALGGKPGTHMPEGETGGAGGNPGEDEGGFGSGDPGGDNGEGSGEGIKPADPYYPQGGGRWDAVDEGDTGEGAGEENGGSDIGPEDIIYVETGGEPVYPFPEDRPNPDNPTDPDNPQWTDDPADPDDGGVIPAEPEPEIEKTVEAENPREDGTVKHQDILTYQVKISNPKAGSLWKDVFIYDHLPEELVLDTEAIELIYPDGRVEKQKAEEVYNPEDRSLEVPIEMLYGGETYILRYKVQVQLPEGEGDNNAGMVITNEAGASGQTPDGERLNPRTELSVFTRGESFMKAVKTGDPGIMLLPVGLMAAAAAGILIFARRKKGES